MSTTECPVCSFRFDTKKKEPKILDCGHTFCKECLLNIQKNNNDTIICPTCRKENSKGKDISEMITNRAILELLYNPNNQNYHSAIIKVEGENKYRFKVILIGKSFSGKTSLIHRYMRGSFNPDEIKATVGREFWKKELKINDEEVVLTIWDTAGMEKYQSITFNYYNNCSGGLIVFDITSRDSFEDADDWLNKYIEYGNKKNLDTILLVGNKEDLSKERKVTTEEAEKYAKEKGISYFETSVLTGKNIENMFEYLVGKMLDNFKKNYKDIPRSIPIPEHGGFSLSPIFRKISKCHCKE